MMWVQVPPRALIFMEIEHEQCKGYLAFSFKRPSIRELYSPTKNINSTNEGTIMNKTELKALWVSIKNRTGGDHAAYMIAKAILSKSNDHVEVAKNLLLKSYSPLGDDKARYGGIKPFNGLIGNLYRSLYSPVFEALDAQQQAEFTSIWRVLSEQSFKWLDDPEYVYIVVRKDLPHVQQAIQFGHAIMAMTIAHELSKKYIGGVNFCYFEVVDENELMSVIRSIKVPNTFFYEPDSQKLWNGEPMGEYSALATVPIRRSRAKRDLALSRLKLFTV